MEQMSLFPVDKEKYIVNSFSADNFCDDAARIELEEKYYEVAKGRINSLIRERS